MAGGTNHPFNDDALAQIFRYSAGRPRKLCKICDNALLTAFSRKVSVIDAAIIEQGPLMMWRMADSSPTPEPTEADFEPETVAA